LVFLLLFCIGRDNPWDPVNNCPEILRREIIKRQTIAIDSSIGKIVSSDTISARITGVLDSVRKLNDSILQINHLIAAKMDSLRKKNMQIDSINRLTAECSIDTQILLGTLPFLTELQAQSFEDHRNLLSIESLKVAALISAGNQECSPQGVYKPAAIDSIFGIVKPSFEKWDSVEACWQLYSQQIKDTNLLNIDIFNRQVEIDNNSIRAYNESRAMMVVYCGKELQSNTDSLKKIIPSLVPGDTLYLDSLNFSSQFTFHQIGDSLGPPIVVIGSPFMNTVVSPAGFFLTESHNIRFYNLVFAGGLHSGVKLELNCSRILFENCVFRNNNLHGVEAIQSSLELRNCQIFHNSGSGIRVQGMNTVEYGLVADNVLVSHNRAYGINSISAGLMISNATISDNGLDGMRLEVASLPATIARSLITFNGYYGLRRDLSEQGQGFFTTPNTNFYGNVSGAMFADSIYLRLNEPYLNENPWFLNRDEDRYLIGSQSNLSGMAVGYRY